MAQADKAVVKEWAWGAVKVEGEAAETEEEMDTIRLVGSDVTFSFECEDYAAITAAC